MNGIKGLNQYIPVFVPGLLFFVSCFTFVNAQDDQTVWTDFDGAKQSDRSSSSTHQTTQEPFSTSSTRNRNGKRAAVEPISGMVSIRTSQLPTTVFRTGVQFLYHPSLPIAHLIGRSQRLSPSMTSSDQTKQEQQTSFLNPTRISTGKIFELLNSRQGRRKLVKSSRRTIRQLVQRIVSEGGRAASLVRKVQKYPKSMLKKVLTAPEGKQVNPCTICRTYEGRGWNNRIADTLIEIIKEL